MDLVVHAASLVCLIGPGPVGAWLRYSLKSASDAKAKDRLFLVKEERKSVDHLILTGIWIISINQAKRHVENRHLNANFRAHAAADVAEFCKQTLVQSDHGVSLRFTANEDLLQPERQVRQGIHRAQAQRFIVLASGDEAVVAGDEAKTGRKREVSKVLASRQRRQRGRCDSSQGPRTSDKAER